MITRRKFLATSAAFGTALIVHPSCWQSAAGEVTGSLTAHLLQSEPSETLITILHTNDTHSQISPVPQNDKLYAGKGGAARRATLAKRVRK